MTIHAISAKGLCIAAVAAGGTVLLGPGLPPRAERPTVPMVAAPARPDKVRAEGPGFDVVRVERDGSAVVAGRGAPGRDVTLLLDGVPLASARGDAAGLFVVLPPVLPEGRHEMTLSLDGAEPGPEAPRVAVVREANADPLVALAPTAGPTEIIAGPAAPPGRPVALLLAEVQGGRIKVLARAPPGSLVGLSVDGQPVDSAVSGPDGRARFDVAATAAAGSRLRVWTGKAGEATASDEDSLVPPSVAPETRIRVVRGQTLWRISREAYGRGARYVAIFGANRGTLTDPDRIRPGQELVVP